MKTLKGFALALTLASCAFLPYIAHAAKRDADAEMTAAWEAARSVAKAGPTEIAFQDQAELKLPEDFVFIPQPQADQLMKAMGNGNDSSRLGLIFPKSDKNWFVVARYIKSGYIKDDDARDWKPDDMLKQFKEGTEETNKERAELGIPEMEIIGWIQPPKYDNAAHRLVWSIESKDKGADPAAERGINYNTYVLGREGYVSLNLVTGKSSVEEDKLAATALLANTSFNSGKTYADFNASTDHVAEYGIAALVAGVAAKKLGMFAIIAAFVAKFAKLFIIAAIAFFGSLAKFFGRKKDDA
jgi:uncharacterized membrane-anchored protein